MLSQFTSLYGNFIFYKSSFVSFNSVKDNFFNCYFCSIDWLNKKADNVPLCYYMSLHVITCHYTSVLFVNINAYLIKLINQIFTSDIMNYTYLK